MRLIDLLPDAEELCALEPDELGLRMLPVLATWHSQYTSPLSLQSVLEAWSGGRYKGEYPRNQAFRVDEAVMEAWAWLEGAALLINKDIEPSPVRILSRKARQLASEPDALKAFSARRVPKEALHPRIREDVWALYHRGNMTRRFSRR